MKLGRGWRSPVAVGAALIVLVAQALPGAVAQTGEAEAPASTAAVVGSDTADTAASLHAVEAPEAPATVNEEADSTLGSPFLAPPTAPEHAVVPGSLGVARGEAPRTMTIKAQLAGHGPGTSATDSRLTFERTGGEYKIGPWVTAKVGGVDVDAWLFNGADSKLGHDLITVDMTKAHPVHGAELEITYRWDGPRDEADGGSWALNPSPEHEAFEFPQPSAEEIAAVQAADAAADEEAIAAHLGEARAVADRASETGSRPATRNSAPITGPESSPELVPWIQDFSNDPNRAPLNDPDFGALYEQNPANHTYTKRPPHGYPIRHRNWCTDYFSGPRGTDRAMRGPENPQAQRTTEPTTGDCRVYMKGEQGAFYSRDHVQWAWQDGGTGRNAPAYRADEFLIGGGDPDAVWYGGTYRPFSQSGNEALPDYSTNYRRTGKPGFQIFVEGVINTDDPGWTYQPLPFSGGAIYMISPDRKIGVWLQSRGQASSFNIQFIDHERYAAAGSNPNNLGRFRAGIPTPGWKRAVLRVGTNEGQLVGPRTDGNGFLNVQLANGYRSAAFVPQWGRAPERTPNLEILKEVANDDVAGDNQITYAITVTNKGRTDSDYELTDTTGYKVADFPAFSPSTTINRVELVDAPTRDRIGEVLSPGPNGGYSLGNGVIRVGEQHRYLVKFSFARNGGAGVNDNRVCTGRPGSGLYNSARVAAGEGDHRMVKEDAACAPLSEVPGPEIEKEPTPPPGFDRAVLPSVDQPDRGTVTYVVRVTNPSVDASVPILAQDLPRFGKAVVVDRVEVDGREQPMAADGRFWLVGNNNGPVVFKPQETRHYRVTLHWRFPSLSAAANSGTLQCSGQPGSGFFNSAGAYVPGDNSRRAQANACAPIPNPEVPKPRVRKRVLNNDQANHRVTYTVEVDNPADGPQKASVWDMPSFNPASRITRITVDGKETTLTNNGEFPVAVAADGGPIELGAGEYRKFEVAIDYEMTTGEAIVAEDLKCTNTVGGREKGLFNVAYVEFAGGIDLSWACADAPNPNYPVALALRKTDTDGNRIGYENNYTFEVRSEDGNDYVANFSQRITYGGEVNLATQPVLEVGKVYQLVETRAPQGFELLPKAIRFYLEYTPEGAVVHLVDPAQAPQVDIPTVDKKDLVVLAVADVRAGNLPKSGGSGVALWFIVGLALISTAAMYSRKRES